MIHLDLWSVWWKCGTQKTYAYSLLVFFFLTLVLYIYGCWLSLLLICHSRTAPYWHNNVQHLSFPYLFFFEKGDLLSFPYYLGLNQNQLISSSPIEVFSCLVSREPNLVCLNLAYDLVAHMSAITLLANEKIITPINLIPQDTTVYMLTEIYFAGGVGDELYLCEFVNFKCG